MSETSLPLRDNIMDDKYITNEESIARDLEDLRDVLRSLTPEERKYVLKEYERQVANHKISVKEYHAFVSFFDELED